MADGETAATVGSSAPGKLTKWAEAMRAREAEEQAKREAEMAEAGANCHKCGAIASQLTQYNHPFDGSTGS